MSSIVCAGHRLDLQRPQVMGILNVTPDSFSDGGRYMDLDTAVARALHMQAQGAAIIDVGGESTRPGAPPVPLAEELERVVPVIEALAGSLRIPISVDTRKPEVMRAAAEAGAGMINDVQALRAPGALEAARDTGLAVCLMHMQGRPADMQRAPRYDDVVAEVEAFLGARVAACTAAGIPAGRLLLDPGFGFGKTLEHNLALLAGLGRLTGLGRPLLVGISRKSMLGAILDQRPTEGRLHAGLAATVLALERGARLIRTHDVGPTLDAIRVWEAVASATGPPLRPYRPR